MVTARRFWSALAAVIVTGGMVFVATPATAAPPCSYASCNNLDPDTLGCSGETVGGERRWDTGSTNEHAIQLRYSSGCDSFWARFVMVGNAFADGCSHAYEAGYRAVLTMEYRLARNAPYEPSARKPTTMKICSQEAGTVGIGWSVMWRSGENYRARVCMGYRDKDGKWTTSTTDCTSWIVRS
jgi:hypothetical protein